LSVAKLRETTEKKGCMVALWIVMVLTAIGVAGSGFLGCFNPTLGTATDPTLKDVMFTVNGRKVTRGQMSLQMQAVAQDARPSTGPSDDFAIVAASLDRLVQAQVVAHMADQRRISVDDDDLLKMASDEADLMIEQFRSDAVAQSDLAQDATESQFQEYFTKTTGQTTTEFKKEVLAQVQKSLDDPVSREAALLPAVRQAVFNSFAATTRVTDDEVKQSYVKYHLLSISFADPEKNLDERMAEADKALAELNAGAKFETVMKRLDEDAPTDPMPYSKSLIEDIAGLKPILDLKPGEHTGVLINFGEPQIFKLVEIKSDLPADYETNKVVLNETYRRQKANNEASKALEDARNTAKIEWKSPGYEATYRVLRAYQTADITDDERKKILLDVVNGTGLTLNDLAGQAVGANARYVAWVRLEDMMTEAEIKEMLRTKEEVVLGALNFSESSALRFELIEVYEALGDQEALAGALETAAEYNTGFAPENELVFAQLNIKLGELEDADKVTPEQALAVRAHLLEWSKRKAEADAAAAGASSDLDEFNVDDEGKPIKESAEDAIKRLLEEANKEPAKGGTTGQGN